jgi:predicted transcriptional regulator
MARPTSKYPTELELEILKIIWRDGPMTVKNVAGKLASKKRKLAITTVQTVMVIMLRKGYLNRGKTGGNFIYQPRLSQSKASRAMVQDLLSRLFGGSVPAMVEALFDGRKLSREDAGKVRSLIG